MKPVIALCLLFSLAAVAKAEDPEATFQGFCSEWMQKLEVREQHNATNIKWESSADGVRGAYVGYTQDHTCILKERKDSGTVGKISYREIRYEKRGGTIAEAEHSVAHPVETTEITEIFRYAKGQWVY